MKITAEEFDERFDNGEDIITLMDNPEVMSLGDFKDKYMNEITINLSKDVYEKVCEKANNLKVKVDDFIKVIVAERVGMA